jgi:uncharacterized protein (TIGR03086 family)
MSSPSPPLPTFLIIGAQKSATRWLRSNLGEHPDIFAAPIEISFFNQRFRRGPDFYRTQFEGWQGEPIVGEATPGYMMWRHRPAKVAKRIKRTIPDVRLIALLRNPIDRANSAMVHHVTKERLPKRSKLVDLVTSKDPEDDRLGLVTGGWYGASLQPYVDLFGDQLLVFLHDDVEENPLDVYRRSLEHIGASPDFVPPELDKVVHSNQKKSPLRRKSSVSDADQQVLWRYFKEDVERLEGLIDRELSSWDPSPDAARLPDLPDDLVDLQRRASAWVLEVMGGVTDEHLDMPTPCPDWTVQVLLDHMMRQTLGFALMVGGTSQAEAVEAMRTAPLAGDPATIYAPIVADLQEDIADPLRLKQTIVFGRRLPIGHYLAWHLVCQLGHGWDLAVATGQDPSMPDDLAEAAIALAEMAVTLLDRTVGFAEPVATGPDATPTDRFVAFLGRNPAVLANI